MRLDSYSGRVSYNPTERWSLNASVGFLKSPEALTPTVSMHRAVASAMYGEALGSGGMFAATAVWGANWHSDAPGASNSALLEAEAMLDDKNTVIGRAEFVQKSAAELSLDTAPAAFPPSERFDVGELSLGYVREILPLRGATLGLGVLGR